MTEPPSPLPSPTPKPAEPRPDPSDSGKLAATPSKAAIVGRPAVPPLGATPTPRNPPVRETIPPSPASRSLALPMLYCLGFVILAGAIAWMWRNPPEPSQAPIGALQARLDDVQARLTRLESRPPDANPAFDPTPLMARIAALEARPATPAGTPNLAPILAPIEARIAALEGRPIADPADAALAERIGRIGRLQSAAAALAAGRPLGKLPGAPPALQRFADAAPPTEAALRLAFPAAARAAMVASRPIDPGLPWLSRIWGRLQELITIRQGERVLVGDPAAGVMEVSRRALAAGDLAGAVAALGRLNPPAAQAMAGWIEQAKSLLEARAALAAMAAQG